MSEHDEDHDRGLSHDLPLISRRLALGLLGGAGLATVLAACSSADADTGTASTASTSPSTSGSGSSSSSSSSTADSTTGTGSTTGTELADGGEEIPEETNGPFPADGSNGVNVLSASGIVRSDIRSSFGDASATADGMPLTFTLTVVDVSSSTAATPVKGAAVYVWHCDRNGDYSMYDGDAKNENYLRGVQSTDASGNVTFTSIFPAAYSGRWPHIHFEVYPSLADATAATNRIRTSRLAMPQAACDEVYATTGYEDSVNNLKQTSLERDMVFGDGYSLQLAKVSGSTSAGYTATLRVPI